jgi:FkbM family methyltransferase
MRYYGQFDPQVDKVLHERYFSNIFNGVSIECGAFDGETDSCTKFFEENYNWKTINIEPLKHVFVNLQKNRPNSINLELALSNNDEVKIFRNYKHPVLGYNWGCGSLTHIVKVKDFFDNYCGENNYEELQVQCKTYSQLIKDLDLKKLDLFILDVEQHEFEVLDGMVGCDVLPDIFVIEHGHRTPECIFEKIKSLNLPYKLDHISFVNSFFVKE